MLFNITQHVLIDQEKTIFSNGCEINQQHAADRLSDRIDHGNLVCIVVVQKTPRPTMCVPE